MNRIDALNENLRAGPDLENFDFSCQKTPFVLNGVQIVDKVLKRFSFLGFCHLFSVIEP